MTNPEQDYFVDETPAESMTPMGGVAVEVWTVNAGIFFDNFVITHSTDAARNFAEATWVMKAAAENRLEKKEKQKNEKKMQETAKKSGSTVDKALVVAEELSAFVMEVYEENPAGVIATGVATFLLLVMLTCFGTSSASMKEAKVPESETATEELRSGVESTPARALSTVTPDPEPEEPVDESDESDEDGEADDGAEDAEDAEDAEEENAQPEAMPSPPLRRTRAATARARAERAKK
jgi:calnexin